MFPSPKTVLAGPLCTGLYPQAQTTSPTTSRKRPAACVNDAASAVYAQLFSAPSMLAYGPQLDSVAYHLGAQPVSAANPLVGSSAQPHFFPPPPLTHSFWAFLPLFLCWCAVCDRHAHCSSACTRCMHTVACTRFKLSC